MKSFTHKIGKSRNDITDMSELILDAFGVKDLIRANNLCRFSDSISCALFKGGF